MADTWIQPAGRFIGHKACVFSCKFSSDGQILGSASTDGRAILWDASTFRPIHFLTGHKYNVLACAFSPDCTLLCTASDDRTAKLWNVRTNVCLQTYTGHTNSCWCCDFSPLGNQVVTASIDTTLRLWDIDSQECVAVLSGHEKPLWGCAYFPDGDTVASASVDATVGLWDVRTRGMTHTLPAPDLAISCAVSPNGLLLCATTETGLCMWDVRTLRRVDMKVGQRVWSCSFAPSGRTLLSTYNLDLLALWDCGVVFGDDSARALLPQPPPLPSPPPGLNVPGFPPPPPPPQQPPPPQLPSWPCLWAQRVAPSAAGTVSPLWDSKLRSCCYAPDGERVIAGSFAGTLSAWSLHPALASLSADTERVRADDARLQSHDTLLLDWQSEYRRTVQRGRVRPVAMQL